MALAVVLIGIVIGAVVFHFVSPWWLTPIASNWGEIDNTLMITLVITAIVFVAINLFLAYCVVRFRHRHGRRAAYEADSKKLEWGLTAITAVGIIAMLAPGLVVYAALIHAPREAAVVEAVGKQWQWRFRLPGKDGVLGSSDTRFVSAENPFGLNPDDPHGQDDVLIDGPELHLPLNRPVKMLLRSQDVLHDFFVPEFRARMDMVPGMVTSFWFTPTKAGTYEILCAELCGVGHFNMRGRVVVDDNPKFLAWLGAQPTFAAPAAKAAAPSAANPAQRGKALAQTHGCVACHSQDGSPSVGPSWKGLFGKTETLADGSTIQVDRAYIEESIRTPGAKLVKGYPPVMPTTQLPAEDIAAIEAYIESGPAN